MPPPATTWRCSISTCAAWPTPWPGRAEPGVLRAAGAAVAGLPDPHRHPRLSRPARARARRDLRGPGPRPGRRARPHRWRSWPATRCRATPPGGTRWRSRSARPCSSPSRACAARPFPRRRSSGSSTRCRRRSACWSWTAHRRAPSTSSSCWWARSSRSPPARWRRSPRSTRPSGSCTGSHAGPCWRSRWRRRPSARARRAPWDALFYASFAVVVTSSVRLAGVLLVFSFLVVPGGGRGLAGRRRRDHGSPSAGRWARW